MAEDKKITHRINGFEQIKGFYSWAFENQEKGIKAQHMSLYLFLLNQNNRVNWVEWFKCPLDLGMVGSAISSKKTYYKCLEDLSKWKLIGYKKGVNTWKAPLIKLEVLKDTSTVPLSEPQPTPQVLPQVLPQQHPINKLLTNNLELVTENLEKWIKQEKAARKKTFVPPTQEEVVAYFIEKGYSASAGRIAFDFYDVADWHDSKGNKIKVWKQKMQIWFKPENKNNSGLNNNGMGTGLL